ncbi:MAG: peptidase MA family metallohydrolase [bacterium]
MQCPKCGYNNPDDALFCNLCHAVFRKESPKSLDVSPEEERYLIMHKHREGGGWKRWVALDVWVSIIVIIGVAFWAANSVMKQDRPPVKTKWVKKSVESKITSLFKPPVSKLSQSLTIKRETSHFVIHCNDEILADEIAGKVEEYYDIPTHLGFGESEFWIKDKVHIYIYDTPQEYAKVTGREGLTSGYSEFKTRAIYSYKDVNHLIEAVIPHELTHLIFADFMEFSSNYPKWLTEGLAMYEETKYCKAYIDNYQKILEQMRGGKYLSVENLTRIDVSKENKIELIHFWYVESMSIVTYLIDVHGRGRLYTFCKKLREGTNLNEALKDAYSPHIKSLPELTSQWLNYIKTNQQSW